MNFNTRENSPRKPLNGREGGFIKTIISIVIVLIIAAYFGYDLREVVDEEFVTLMWENIKEWLAVGISFIESILDRIF